MNFFFLSFSLSLGLYLLFWWIYFTFCFFCKAHFQLFYALNKNCVKKKMLCLFLILTPDIFFFSRQRNNLSKKVIYFRSRYSESVWLSQLRNAKHQLISKTILLTVCEEQTWKKKKTHLWLFQVTVHFHCKEKSSVDIVLTVSYVPRKKEHHMGFERHNGD